MSIITSLGLKGAQFNALQGLAATDLGIDQIIGIVQGLAPGITGPTVTQAITAIRGLSSGTQYVARVNLNKKLNPARLPQSITEQHENYNYLVNLTVQNKKSGEKRTITRKLATNTFIPYKAEVIDKYIESWLDEQNSYGEEFVSGTVVNVFVKPGTNK